MRNFRIVYTIEKNNKSYQESFFCKTKEALIADTILNLCCIVENMEG